ncbi:MAG: hypothetical protein CME65_11510 [Halobacteriovoraceae bacterium]|nr:hypothetical protein [Halobacteriovoraceae bacterium]|tara:strand:+ start:6082 stop:7563 length:1482 start_codon:yes stop_codon:yes gene_type:complete
MSEKKYKILVVAEHEDEGRWTSIDHLLDSFKNYWKTYESFAEVEFLDQITYPFIKEDLLRSIDKTHIVFLRLSVKETMYLQSVRSTVNSNAICVAYTEESPSIGFFNYKTLGLDKILRSDDVLVAQNMRDVDLIQNLTNLEARYIPCQSPLQPRSEIRPREVKNFCYIGRYTNQKNIHTLFWAISLVAKEMRMANAKLYLWGMQDNYGSPNMAIPSGPYLEQLYQISIDMGVADLIEFREFCFSKEELYEEVISVSPLMISPSLHSDEDFGFTVLECLSQGIPCLISNWGGYHQFIEDFKGSVFSIPVYKSEFGPFLFVTHMAEKMRELLGRSFEVPFHWSKKYETYELVDLESKNLRGMFKFSELALKIHRNAFISPQVRAGERQWPHHGIIYKGYNDPLSLEIFSYYGAERYLGEDDFSYQEKTSLVLAPWCYKSGDEIVSDDYHRGQFRIKVESGEFEIRTYQGELYTLAKTSLQRLLSVGALGLLDTSN